ncbi:MAG: VCBS repeat-containing protein [Planctomycetota bacterium]
MRTSVASLGLLLCACSHEDAGPALTGQPLPPRAAVAGPRFERLDGAATGLSFTNELKRPNLVAYVYAGAGVAVGDYDGDGLPDVYLVSQDGPNKLFRQTSPLHFEDATAKAGGLGGGDAWGTAAAFADVDNDGDLDLYVCNLESPNLLYLNRGDGTFEEAAGRRGLAAVAASMGCAFADYDNDGDLDLYLLTNRVLGPQLPPEIVADVQLPKDVRKTKAELLPGGASDSFVYGDHRFPAGQPDRLYRNDGGVFKDVSREAGIDDHGMGLSVVWWDYDGDGRLDLYVANDLQSPDKLYHNRGDGTFADVTGAMLPHTAFFGMGCDFGDLDGDGRFDLLVADMSSTSHYWGKMLMGSMDQHRWFLMNSDPQQYMRNALYVNTGTGRFEEAGHLTRLSATDWTWSVRFGDLDEDGRLDCHVTNGIAVFTDNPDFGNQFKQLWEHGAQKQALDLYRKLEPVKEKNIARRNLGDLQFEDVGKAWGLDEESVGQGAVLVDLDRDGDLDVIVNNQNAAASLFVNRTADTHRVLVKLVGSRSNREGIGAVITVDAGGQHMVRQVMGTRGYMSAGEAVEHFGLGAAARIDRIEVAWPSGIRQEFRDVAADQWLTIREEGEPAQVAPTPAQAAPAPLFAEHAGIAFAHRERDFDDFAEQPLLPHRLSRLGPGLATGDVNGDGKPDVWVGGAAGQPGALLLAKGDGTFAPALGPWRDDAECEDLGALLFDADGDGDLDLHVCSGGIEAGEHTERYRDRLYTNDGKGGFARAAADALPDLRFSSSCVAACDYDGDGDQDLFVGSRVVPGKFPNAPTSVLLQTAALHRSLTLKVPLLATAGMVTGATWTDLDGDGRKDLVLAAEWQPLRAFANTRDGFVDRTEALGLAKVKGQWTCVVAADLDGDGDQDLVAGNLGLNTKYKADDHHPLRLFGRDFDGNGSFDVVEAKMSGDTELPVRGLSCSSGAMPFLRQRFPTYDQFARATLKDIYGDALQQSVELECNELRSCVFENRGGAFVAAPLPRRAQISCVNAIGVADFDGDGVPDLVLAQNSFSPEPETGHIDGGLGCFLRGTGKLGFDVVGAGASGIVMPGDTRALIVLDLDGDGVPDFVAATSDGPLRAFVARRPRR